MIPWLLLFWFDTGDIVKPHLIGKYTQIALECFIYIARHSFTFRDTYVEILQRAWNYGRGSG